MAGSYLSFHELQKQPDQVGAIWAEGIKSVGKSAANLLNKYHEVKEKNLQNILTPQSDVNSIVNQSFRLVGVQDYDAFKTKWMQPFKEQRGILTSAQKLEMQNDMSEIQKEAEYMNQVSKYIDNAQQAAQKGKLKAFDQNALDEIMKYTVPGEDGKINKDEFYKAVTKAMKSETGVPFLNYQSLDPQQLLSYRSEEIKGTPGIVEEGNKKYRKYEKTPEMLRDNVAAYLFNGDFDILAAANNTLMKDNKYLTPEDKIAADKKYLDDPFALLRYYVNDKYDYSQHIKPTFVGLKAAGKKTAKSTKVSLEETERTDFNVDNHHYYVYMFPTTSTKQTANAVVNAKLVSGNTKEDMGDMNTPMELFGYDKAKDVILWKNTVDYMVYETPRKGNETTLKNILSEDDYKRITKKYEGDVNSLANLKEVRKRVPEEKIPDFYKHQLEVGKIDETEYDAIIQYYNQNKYAESKAKQASAITSKVMGISSLFKK